jgi:RHS repeat-associated protein
MMVCDDNGMPVEKETYDAFGKGMTKGISKCGMSSNMYDSDAGLYYFAARWYDGKTGKFVEMDPVVNDRTIIDMYEFPNNNPVSCIDVYGEGLFEDLFGITAQEFWDYGVEKKEPAEVYSENVDKSNSSSGTDSNKGNDSAIDVSINFASELSGITAKAFSSARQMGAKFSSALAGASKNAAGLSVGLSAVGVVLGVENYNQNIEEINKLDVSDQRKQYLKGKAAWTNIGSFIGGYVGGAVGASFTAEVGGVIGGAVVGTVGSWALGSIAGFAYDIITPY